MSKLPEIRSVFTPDAPEPAGHYSQAIVYNGLVFVAGQLPIHPKTKEKVTGTIEEQTALVLSNLAAILKASGSNMEHVLKVTVYVTDVDLWGRVNAVYSKVFGSHRPARAIVPVKELHYGFQLEVEAIAAVRSS